MKLNDVRALARGIDRLTLWLRHRTSTQFSSSTITALDRLRSEGPLRVSELARLEAMTQPGITLLVNRLAEAGFAERVPDPTDRRATLVRITDDGIDVLVGWHNARADVLRARLAELDDHDHALLSAALPAIERLVADQAAPYLRKARS